MALGIFSCSKQTLSCAMWDPVPQLGMEPGPLPWEHGVLATGPPGKLRLCISDKLPGDFDGLVNGPPKESPGWRHQMGRGEPGRQQELPRFALHPRLIGPRLGFLPCAGPGDRGLAHVALHTSVSSLFPHTIDEHLFGAGSRISTGRT